MATTRKPVNTSAPRADVRVEVETATAIGTAHGSEEATVTEAEPVAVEIDTRPAGIRTSSAAWWCPNDDTSMPFNMPTCPVCGFARP